MQGVYRFRFDAGRCGCLHGLFVATEADVKGIIGREAYFGEVLGKHSEVRGPIEQGDIELVTQDQEFVRKFVEYGCATGFSPWDGLDDEDGGDSDDDDGVSNDEDDTSDAIDA